MDLDQVCVMLKEQYHNQINSGSGGWREVALLYPKDDDGSPIMTGALAYKIAEKGMIPKSRKLRLVLGIYKDLWSLTDKEILWLLKNRQSINSIG